MIYFNCRWLYGYICSANRTLKVQGGYTYLASFVHTDSRGGYNDDCIRFCSGSYKRVSRCHRDDIETLIFGVFKLFV